MARPPKPTALKRLTGNPGGRPLPVEPEFPPLSELPPPDLTGEARAEWVRLVPMLISAGVATAADYSVVWDYCYSFGKVAELSLLIQAQGLILENRNGERQRHPAIMALQNFQRMKEAARIQLGLTPVARARINPNPAEQAEQENPWAEEYGA